MPDKHSWNKFVLEHAPRSGAFLQSWEWGGFQEAVGKEVRRYQDSDSLAQVVSHPLPLGLKGWNLYRGPIVRESGIRNKELGIFDTIIPDLKKTNGLFIHIEPNEEFQVSSFDPAGHHPKGDKLQAAKTRQPQHTLIVDLRKHEEFLLSEMHEKTRYNIRLAEKHGVQIKKSDSIDDFLKLLKETAKRDQFSTHPEIYYRKMVETMPEVKLFVAYHDGMPLAAALVIFFGNTATYLHGASSNEKRNLMASHLLHWRIMQEAKSHGCTSYDFWGIAPFLESRSKNQEARHPWDGITRFKKGFGGEAISSPPALELPLKPFQYKIYRFLKTLRP